MINLLLESYDLGAPWLYPELKKYVHATDSVAVVAFSFRDAQAKNAEDWESLYGRDHGKYYGGIVEGLASYGISEDKITFINYFTDTKGSARKKIADADILYFPGGLPDRMMDRIRELELTDALIRHDKVVMGFSAGALIQLAEYHLSPDDDYPAFGYYEGLPYLKDFYLEVHYEGTGEQSESIRRVLTERGKPVFATAFLSGAILVDNGKIKLLGNVKTFEPD